MRTKCLLTENFAVWKNRCFQQLSIQKSNEVLVELTEGEAKREKAELRYLFLWPSKCVGDRGREREERKRMRIYGRARDRRGLLVFDCSGTRRQRAVADHLCAPVSAGVSSSLFESHPPACIIVLFIKLFVGVLVV